MLSVVGGNYANALKPSHPPRPQAVKCADRLQQCKKQIVSQSDRFCRVCNSHGGSDWPRTVQEIKIGDSVDNRKIWSKIIRSHTAILASGMSASEERADISGCEQLQDRFMVDGDDFVGSLPG